MLGSLLDILFPPVCMLCNAELAEEVFCETCTGSMEKITNPLCVICGVPFISLTGPSERPCSVCLSKKKIPYLSARSALYYTGGVLKAIHDFKYFGKVALKGPLGGLMAEAAGAYWGYPEDPSPGPGVIVTAVPLHKKRLKERGYNQSVLLAGELSNRFSLELDRSLLKRVRLTRPQVELNGRERRRNVRGAFEVTAGRELEGREVILIDDVYTTGATVTECARLLKERGASVKVLTLARAVSM